MADKQSAVSSQQSAVIGHPSNADCLTARKVFVPQSAIHACSRHARSLSGFHCQVNHLAELAAGGVGVGAEVGPVLRVTRLARPAAGIAVDDTATGHPLDVCVEGLGPRHVSERLAGGHIREVRRVSQDLGDLGASNIVVGAEVGPVLRVRMARQVRRRRSR